MPNNKKKKSAKKKPQRDNGGPASFSLAPTRNEEEPEYYREPAQRRPIPDMRGHDPTKMKARLFALPASERSATARRFARAYELIDALDDGSSSSPATSSGTNGAARMKEADIDELVRDARHMRMCSHIIRAVQLTNMRVAITANILRGFRLPTCWSHITQLRALDSGDVQLAHMGAKAFVALLATAIVFSFCKNDHPALHIMHELYLHAENGFDWLDWDDLADDEVTADLDVPTLRFVLAIVAIKVARGLYRERGERTFYPNQPPIPSRFLLDSIEIFARDQIKYQPKSAAGYWNLGWIAQESVAKRGVHPLEGTAECLAMMRQCYQVADEEDDDFRKATARIEAATCILLGGDGMLGYQLPNGGERVQVKRDFRAEANQQRDMGGGMLLTPMNFRIFAETPEGQQATIEKEKCRMSQGVPTSVIEPDEELLVAQWEVRRLWNEAMQGPYDSLCRWGHESVVYGECCGWDAVV